MKDGYVVGIGGDKPDIVPDRLDVGRELRRIETRIYVDQLLACLDDTSWCLIAAYYWQGMTFAEIGRDLGLKEAGAKWRHDRAIEKMRRAIEKMRLRGGL